MTVKEDMKKADGEGQKSMHPNKPGWRTIVDQFSRTAESHEPCHRCGKVLVLVQKNGRGHHGLCNDCREK